MSLKFLAKKSWHTTNLDNVEKVWIQEQRAAEESKKLAELQKQILEEKQIQELRQLQLANGQILKTVDTTLDWMYEGPSAHQDQSSEEYLLGKIYKPQENQASDVKLVSKEPGSLWMNKISTKNDLFSRVHEDPLLVMKKNEKLSRENVLNNPVKMARIRHTIAAELEQKELEKKAKKDAKKLRKESKHASRKLRSRSRSRSPEEKKHRRHSRSESRGRDDRAEQVGESSKRGRHDDSVSRDQTTNRGDEHNEREVDRKYGLMSRGGDESERGRDKSYLGPRPELVSKKAERDAKEAAERRRQPENARPLSEQERARRLEEMRRDAELNDELRLHRQRPGSSSASTLEVTTNKVDGTSSRSNPLFLQSMRADVYTSASEISMEERLRQNRHYVQKASDMESGQSFIKR